MQSRLLVPVFAAVLAVTGGCVGKVDKVAPLPVVQDLATLSELLERFEPYSQVSSLRARADIQLSIVSDDGRKRTTYSRTRSEILVSEPGQIRIRAYLRGLGSTIFDMAARGNSYRVSVPPKGRFYYGGEEGFGHEIEQAPVEVASPSSANGEAGAEEIADSPRLQRVDPRDILNALVIAPYDSEKEYPVLDSYTIGSERFQVLQFQKAEGMGFRITRKVFFHRRNLELARVQLYAEDSRIETDVTYLGWSPSPDALYPQAIDLARPIDGYGLSVDLIEPAVNVEVPEDRFDLEPPDGATIRRIGPPERPAARAEARR